MDEMDLVEVSAKWRDVGESRLVDIDDREEYFMAMISDCLLIRMPLRKRDGARVIDPERTTAKTFSAQGDTVYVQRWVVSRQALLDLV
ncbi:hypothetical protein COOONC_19928 [Cooperia oncophora]